MSTFDHSFMVQISLRLKIDLLHSEFGNYRTHWISITNTFSHLCTNVRCFNTVKKICLEGALETYVPDL